MFMIAVNVVDIIKLHGVYNDVDDDVEIIQFFSNFFLRLGG